MHEVGTSANAAPRVYQNRRTGKWNWEVADWAGYDFSTEAEAAADMQRVRTREKI
jgi:hypothetical protein